MPLPPTGGADRALNISTAMANRRNQGPSLDAFGEWDRLLHCADQLSEGLLGQTRNFIVRLCGSEHVCSGIAWVRADLVEASSMQPQTTRVVLKLRLADWTVVQHATQPLKILQSVVARAQSEYILDCTRLDSVVVSIAPICTGESVQVAELFCGGFNGYAQAAYVLHRHGTPIHMKWSLDKDDECVDMIRCRCPETVFVRSAQELHEAVENPSSPIHVVADINHNWWLRMFAHVPVNAVCLSPPCQPWSAAGSESGLCSDEGLLLLRAIEILGALHVPVAVFEEVSNFASHPHHGLVMQAWQVAGYRQVWVDTLNLLDVLPTQRVRHMAVYVHHTAVGAVTTVQAMSWASQRRQSLASADALFNLQLLS